jgi:hypothetical protein
MGWSSKSGRAFTSLNRPRAFGVSDRDGAWRNHADMAWQYQYAGNSLVNLRLLVGRDELDTPNEQLKNPYLPPDPVPIKDPRTEPFAYDANPSTVTNWDTPGADWDQSGNQWDNLVQD